MKKIKTLVVLFQIGMFFSGITAFVIPWGVNLIMDSAVFENTSLLPWLTQANEGIQYTHDHYQFLFYGSDWLAFAHILFVILFIGAYRNPVKNKWLFEFGLIASALVIPAAFLMGYVRGIPFLWSLLDCSFGIGAGLLHFYTLRLVRQAEKFSQNNFSTEFMHSEGL